ncbi:MAG: carbohydrate-binding family 9-like protein [Acidobacteriota bacterium]
MWFSPLPTGKVVAWMLLPAVFSTAAAWYSLGESKKMAFPCDEKAIAHYTAYRVRQPIRVDGRLDEECWRNAPRSSRFADLVSGEPTLYDTRAAVLWDDENLYVGFWVEEPDVRARLTKRDAPIYEDNDVEVFIAGQDAYYEFEINALNTIYEVFFIWEEAYERGGYASIPEFKRSHPEVRPFNGVGFTTHPRGQRLGFWNWDFPGLRSAVWVDGTLNNSQDKDQGWTVELAFPWQGMKWLAKGDGRALPPREGDVWRMDFSRFNQYKAPPPANDSGGWAWSPHGIWDSHIPECFPYIHFSLRDVAEGE